MSPQELDDFLTRLAQRQDQFQTMLNNMAATFAQAHAQNEIEHRRIRAELREMRREGLRIMRELADAHLSLENKMEQLENALENFLRRSGDGNRPA